MDAQRELDAVVAHGLLNSLAVISSAASAILQFGASMGEDDRRVLTAAIEEQSCLFIDGLQVLIREASETFADAATAVALAAGVADSVAPEDRDLVLQAVVRRSALVRQALDGLVRGLPDEVLSLLADGTT